MGRSWKWKAPAGVLAGILFSMLAVLWDVHARAERALDRHRKSVEADIDRLRAESSGRALLLEEWEPARGALDRILAASSRTDPRLGSLLKGCPFELGDLQDLITRRGEGSLFPFEDAAPAGEVPFQTRHRPVFGTTGGPAETSDLEEMRIRTVLAQEIPSTGGLGVALLRVAWERNVDQAWRAMLGRDDLSSKDLEAAARTLEQLERKRAGLMPTFLAEHVFQRNAVLRHPRPVWGDEKFVKGSPGWREFYSWDVFLARILADHDRHYRILDERSSEPLERQLKETEDWYDEPAGNSRWETPLRYPGRELLGYEREAQRRRILRAVTVAVKRYTLDHTRVPPSLPSLVPGYLLEVPQEDGLRYSQGRVSFRGMPAWR